MYADRVGQVEGEEERHAAAHRHTRQPAQQHRLALAQLQGHVLRALLGHHVGQFLSVEQRRELVWQDESGRVEQREATVKHARLDEIERRPGQVRCGERVFFDSGALAREARVPDAIVEQRRLSRIRRAKHISAAAPRAHQLLQPAQQLRHAYPCLAAHEIKRMERRQVGAAAFGAHPPLNCCVLHTDGKQVDLVRDEHQRRITAHDRRQVGDE
mmetsp:Transcript_39066/g.91398  ORF Transcript_39066/g.91398 Transcript_39066/m.91398 type:complete len:214 (+) Transcript_39066:530-1171(+)